MLQRFRERLVVILLALLPFHALLLTTGTKILRGPGYAPLPVLAVWKEVLLSVVLGTACIEILLMKRNALHAVRHADAVDGGVALFGGLAIAVSALTHGDLRLLVLGAKYDLLPLLVFLVLRRVPWSDHVRRSVVHVLRAVGVCVAVYGMFALLAPQAWFTWLGYSDLHSLYFPGGPLAPFHQVEAMGIRRMQSVMSGPNQLGLWMLLPLAACLAEMDHRRSMRALSLAFALTGLAILLSFSRSAWIAAAGMILVVSWHRRTRVPFLRVIGMLTVAGTAVVAIGAALFPSIVLREMSSGDHLRRPLAAVRTMAEHPFGMGLGTAGPASNRVSDACVHLPEGADVSWTEHHPDLCVFVGATQVRPADRPCACPVLPENWYLQVGVETGVAGMVLFMICILLVLRKLWIAQKEAPASPFSLTVLLALLGVSIAGIFLHSFEDSAVAYSVWMLAGMALPPPSCLSGGGRDQGRCARRSPPT